MTDAVTVREATRADIPDIARIYKQCFPDDMKTLLGDGAVRQYFEALIAHDAYKVYVAVRGDGVKGFQGHHIDRTRSIGRRWYARCWPAILLLVLRRPRFCASRAIYVAREAVMARRTTRGRAGGVPQADLRGTAYWDTVGVDRDALRGGIAAALVSDGIAKMRALGIREIKLSVDRNNFKSIGLVEKFGFERVPTAEGMKFLVFRKDLVR